MEPIRQQNVFKKRSNTYIYIERERERGAGEDGGGDDNGRSFPEHPSPILHAPRNNISRKGKSLNPIMLYMMLYMIFINITSLGDFPSKWLYLNRHIHIFDVHSLIV